MYDVCAISLQCREGKILKKILKILNLCSITRSLLFWGETVGTGQCKEKNKSR